MKINKIQLNCHRDTSFGNELGADPAFIFFRSPVVYRQNGVEYTTSRSSAVILSGGYKHDFSPVKGDTLRYDLIGFKTVAADRQYISSMNLPLDIPVELEDDYVISNTLRSMKSQSMRRGKRFGEFMELSMRIIFIVLSEMTASHVQLPEEKIPKYAELKLLRESVYEEPMNSWSVDDMCEDMQISRTYFHRLYLKAFGVTFRQDVIESRLIHAADLLKNTDLSVTAISEICGYDSESYFMRQFKTHKGCTPSEYRRRITAQEE